VVGLYTGGGLYSEVAYSRRFTVYTQTCGVVVRARQVHSVAQVVIALHLLWLGQTSVYKFSLDNSI
jgi:hypothetical protein